MSSVSAQVPPSSQDVAGYNLFFKAVYDGDFHTVKKLLARSPVPRNRDGSMRSPLHVAAYQSEDEILRLLVEAGGDINALEYMRYDVITIAAVENDVDLLNLALRLGGNPTNVTSRYDGTALIAAAHLGHDEVVEILLQAGAPVDHVNNLGWTALLEAVILGDGSEKYVRTVRHLINHDAGLGLVDGQGLTALDHARQLGYTEIIELLEN